MTSRCLRRGKAGAVMLGAVLALLTIAVGGNDPAQAQNPAPCRASTAAATCNDARNACEQECRARLFSVDPARATCLAACASGLRDCHRVAALERTDASACRRAE